MWLRQEGVPHLEQIPYESDQTEGQQWWEFGKRVFISYGSISLSRGALPPSCLAPHGASPRPSSPVLLRSRLCMCLGPQHTLASPACPFWEELHGQALVTDRLLANYTPGMEAKIEWPFSSHPTPCLRWTRGFAVVNIPLISKQALICTLL